MTGVSHFRSSWSIAENVTYLNHGSFGPAPLVVQEVREEWSRRLERQPMEFYLDVMGPALDHATECLAKFIEADAADLAFVDNATVAMNVVAGSVELGPGDEILLNDHEYGAVFRIWRRVCEQTGARLVTARLGDSTVSGKSDGNAEFRRRRFMTEADIIDPIFAAVTERTKLIVISHITSPSAMIMPVTEICRRARQQRVPVCIDGPHAIAMRPVNLKEIGCDYYCASLHKWLSAPLGSGFLYVQRQRQSKLQPHMTSWGRSLSGSRERWQDQLNWLGTRDPAPFLSVPAAIQFIEQIGLEDFRESTHQLAQIARQELEQLFNTQAWIPDSPQWYGSMIAVPLPASDYKKPKPNSIHPWQQALRDRCIEALVTECSGQSFFRVSCHLYNTVADIDRLIATMAELIRQDTK